MPRRFLNRTLRTLTPDEAALDRYLLRFTGRQLHTSPQTLPRMESRALFGDDRPLELEVGCGSGEYLCHLARNAPEVNFVGVDLHMRSLHKAVWGARGAALPNIVFVRGDFKQMYPLLAPASLRAIYLHFPDPNTERKFHKRRIYSPRFLDEARRALAPGGRLSVMTDHTECFLEMLSLAEGRPGWERAHAERYLVGFEPEVKSRYQRIWEGHGLPPLRFELRKPEDGHGRPEPFPQEYGEGEVG